MFKELLLKIFGGGNQQLNESDVAELEGLFDAAVADVAAKRVDEACAAKDGELEDMREQLAESASFNAEAVAMAQAKGMDQFLDMVVESWAEKNSEALAGQAINESAQLFLMKLSEAASQFNTVIPTSDVEPLHEAENEIASLKERLNHALTVAADARTEVIALRKEGIITSLCEGMDSEMSAETLRERLGNVDFINEEQFTKTAKGMKLIVEAEAAGDDDDDKDTNTNVSNDEEKDKKDVDPEKDNLGKPKNENDGCGAGKDEDGKKAVNESKKKGKKNEAYVDGTGNGYPKDLNQYDNEGKKKINESVDYSGFSRFIRPKK